MPMTLNGIIKINQWKVNPIVILAQLFQYLVWIVKLKNNQLKFLQTQK